MNRVDDSGNYDGSRVFSFLVEPLGLSVDQVFNNGIFHTSHVYQFFFLDQLSTESV